MHSTSVQKKRITKNKKRSLTKLKTKALIKTKHFYFSLFKNKQNTVVVCVGGVTQVVVVYVKSVNSVYRYMLFIFMHVVMWTEVGSGSSSELSEQPSDLIVNESILAKRTAGN